MKKLRDEVQVLFWIKSTACYGICLTNNCSLGPFLGSCSQYSHEIPGYSLQQRRRELEQD